MSDDLGGILTGDFAALVALRKWVLGILRRKRSLSESDVEDLTHSVLEKSLNKMQGEGFAMCKDVRALKAYVSAMAEHALIDKYRRERREPFIDESLSETIAADPEAQVRLVLADITAVLGTVRARGDLSPAQYAALLRRIEMVRGQDLSELLIRAGRNVSPESEGTLQRRAIHAARAGVRRALLENAISNEIASLTGRFLRNLLERQHIRNDKGGKE